MSWLEFALNPFPDLFGGAARRRAHEGQGRAAQEAAHRRSDRRRVRLPDAHRSRRHGRHARARDLWRPRQHRGARCDRVGATRVRSSTSRARPGGWIRRKRRRTWPGCARSIAICLPRPAACRCPGDAYDGALINHPDIDLADPALNTSGVPWHTLYYQANYPRLQRIKAQWDPLNVFRHDLSIRAEG